VLRELGLAVSEALGFKVRVLGWREVSRLVFKLWAKVRHGGFRPDLVVAILRGGCLVGLLMADLYGVNFETLRVEHYRGLGVKGRLRLTHPLRAEVKGRKILLVDDVADSGETLKLAFRYLKRRGASEVRTGTLHVKPWTAFPPDCYAEKTEAWIVYPWERGELARAVGGKMLERGEAPGKVLEALEELGVKPSLAAEILGFKPLTSLKRG
jgi:hypothetical protein